MQVSGHTSIGTSLNFCPVFLKCPELGFLTANALRFTEQAQRVEKNTKTWAFGGEAERYMQLAIPLFVHMLRGRFTK